MDRHEITLWIEYVNTLLLVYIFRNLIGHGFFSLYIDLQGSFFLQFNRTPRKQPLEDIKKSKDRHITKPSPILTPSTPNSFSMCLVKLRMQIPY